MKPMPLVPRNAEPMDPTLFALDWNVAFEVLMEIVLLSLVLERALALLFESRFFLKVEERREKAGQGSFKPLIAFLVASAGCILWQFDALSILLTQETMTILGSVITGAVVAGGSKGSVKLFHDVLGIYSTSYAEAKMGIKPKTTKKPSNSPPEAKNDATSNPK